jgi:hypothetical protein
MSVLGLVDALAGVGQDAGTWRVAVRAAVTPKTGASAQD